jgi:small subunit ribosomal protein S16
MLKIRLQRVGRKHEPTFRVVLTDSKNSTKSGRFLEVLGSYDPRKTTEVFKADRIKHWISQGAKPTDTLHNIFIDQKIIEGKKVNVLPKKTPQKKAVEEPTTNNAQPATEEKEAEEPVVEEKTEEVASEVVPETEVKDATDALAQESPNETSEEVKSEESRAEEKPLA